MPLKLENYIPLVAFNGVNTDKAVVLGSTMSVAGLATFAATPVFTAGVPKGLVIGTTATYALTAAQTGTVFVATAASGTQTYTLPAVAAGLTYTFICGHAAGEILVTPTGSVGTTFATFAAVGVDADTAIVTLTAGTGLKNTAATNAISDCLTLISDGVGWRGIGITSGIWATQ